MTKKRTGILAASATTMLLALVVLTALDSSAAETLWYEITVTNITPGQPLTSPLLVIHDKESGFFTLGEKASSKLQQLAENGYIAPLADMLSSMEGVVDIVQGESPLLPANDPAGTGAGYTENFTITAERGAMYLSYASMLVCTNDGFAGLDTIRLPVKSKTVYVKTHDARTEMNTEDFAYIVPPCQATIWELEMPGVQTRVAPRLPKMEW